MRLRTRLSAIAFLVTVGLLGSAIKRTSEAQSVCFHYTWSTFPECNVPCICDTCQYCPK